MKFRLIFLPLLVSLGFATDQECVLELTNGDRTHILLHSLNQTNLDCRISFDPSQPIIIDHTQIQKIHFSEQPLTPPTDGDELQLRDYTKLYGSFKELTAETIRFDSQATGSIILPIDIVERVSRVQPPGRIHTGSRSNEFVVLLENGDRLSGALHQKGPTFTVRRDQLDAEFDVASFRQILLPLPPQYPMISSSETEMVFCEIELRSGARVFGSAPQAKDGFVHTRLEGGPEVQIPFAKVQNLSISSGRIPSSRNVLVWQQFADKDEEALRTIKILKEGLSENWSIKTEDDSPVGIAFRKALFQSRALVIPEMEVFRQDMLGKKTKLTSGAEHTWRKVFQEQTAPLFQEYVRRGGRIIFLCIEDERLELAKLLGVHGLQLGANSLEAQVHFTRQGEVYSEGIGETFSTTDATAFYEPVAPPLESIAVAKDGMTPAVKLPQGSGAFYVLGMDYYSQNKATAALLVNVIKQR